VEAELETVRIFGTAGGSRSEIVDFPSPDLA
jgi:hypothetical protein